jgi:hypothetical protein
MSQKPTNLRAEFRQTASGTDSAATPAMRDLRPERSDLERHLLGTGRRQPLVSRWQDRLVNTQEELCDAAAHLPPTSISRAVLAWLGETRWLGVRSHHTSSASRCMRLLARHAIALLRLAPKVAIATALRSILSLPWPDRSEAVAEGKSANGVEFRFGTGRWMDAFRPITSLFVQVVPHPDGPARRAGRAASRRANVRRLRRGA